MTDVPDPIQQIVHADDRYRPEAYLFTREALEHTMVSRRNMGLTGHIDGRQLMFGVRDLARQRFGYLAATVFRAWGLKSTGCFGEIVWNLVDAQLMSRQDSDTKADFEDVYGFTEAFETQFLHDANNCTEPTASPSPGELPTSS